MKKAEQLAINNRIKLEVDAFNVHAGNILKVEKFRSCSAKVLYFDEYIALQSYNTIVAFIRRDTSELFDILRYVYGYTATSAQHIAKFKHDYFNAEVYTYRD